MPHQQEAVLGHGRGELPKSSLQLPERMVAIEVVGLDAQNGGVPRPQVQKVGPILAGLDEHQPIVAGTLRVPSAWSAIRIKSSAEGTRSIADGTRSVPATWQPAGASARGRPERRCSAKHGRIKARSDEHVGSHGRGGRLSVRTGDGYHVRGGTQPAQHLKVANCGNAEFFGPLKFWILGRHGIAEDHHLGFGWEMFGGVAGIPTDSVGSQAVGSVKIQV